MKEIHLSGPIVDDSLAEMFKYWGDPYIAAKDVKAFLETVGDEDIVVKLNTYGGDVTAGAVIFSYFKEIKNNVTFQVIGSAASMGSILMLSGNKLELSPLSTIMIHNPSAMVAGDHRAMESMGKLLLLDKKQLADVYIEKTGLSEERVFDMMDNETWLSAKEAVELGFADSIMFENEYAVAASVANDKDYSEKFNTMIKEKHIAMSKESQTLLERAQAAINSDPVVENSAAVEITSSATIEDSSEAPLADTSTATAPLVNEADSIMAEVEKQITELKAQLDEHKSRVSELEAQLELKNKQEENIMAKAKAVHALFDKAGEASVPVANKKEAAQPTNVGAFSILGSPFKNESSEEN